MKDIKEEHKIENNIEKSQYLQCMQELNKGSVFPSNYKVTVVGLILLYIIYPPLMSDAFFDEEVGVSPVILVFGLFMIYIVGKSYIYTLANNKMKMLKFPIHTTVIVDEKSILYCTDILEKSSDWESVKAVYETKNYIFSKEFGIISKDILTMEQRKFLEEKSSKIVQKNKYKGLDKLIIGYRG